MVQSSQFSLNLRDALHGLIMAVAAPVLLAVQQTISAGSLTLNWKALGMTAIAAGVAYLAKQYFSAPSPIPTGK